jgi:TRAP-type mannitol/chloroaromatic compound transport system permease small subunit
MNSKLRLFIHLVDTFIEWTGKTASWLVVALILLICYNVTMRYFARSDIAFQELEWHLFALIFLLGAAYTLKHDQHVRVDIFYQSHFMSDYKRAIVNIFGILFLLLPFCILVLTSSWPFVANAFYYNEGSPDPGGLPYRFLLKGSLLIAFSLLILQALADLFRNILILRHKHEVK